MTSTIKYSGKKLDVIDITVPTTENTRQAELDYITNHIQFDVQKPCYANVYWQNHYRETALCNMPTDGAFTEVLLFTENGLYVEYYKPNVDRRRYSVNMTAI